MTDVLTVDECVDFVQQMLDFALCDATLAAELSKTYVLLKIVHSDPDGVLLIDVPTADVWTGSADDPADTTLRMSADVAWQLWHGTVDLVDAITDRRVRAEGDVRTVANVVPLVGRVFRSCADALPRDARADLS